MLAIWLLGGLSIAAADKMLPDSTVADWSAVVSEVTLDDKSVLFEYTARTFSGTVEGAMLAISFVPRFNCDQLVSVRLPVEFQPETTDVVLEFLVGDDKRDFVGLVDDSEDFLMFSVGANAEQIGNLRKALDTESRATVRVTPVGDNALTGSGVAFSFSLLGSRLAALAAQDNCLSHVPLAYNPNQAQAQ